MTNLYVPKFLKYIYIDDIIITVILEFL